MCCLWNTYFLELSYLQQVKLWNKKFIAKTLGYIHPFDSRFKFLYQFNMLWHRDSSKFPKSWPLPYTQQIFHLPIIPNLHTPWQIFLFPDLWQYINFNCAKYLITISLWLEAKEDFSKSCAWDGYFHQNPLFVTRLFLYPLISQSLWFPMFSGATERGQWHDLG